MPFDGHILVFVHPIFMDGASWDSGVPVLDIFLCCIWAMAFECWRRLNFLELVKLYVAGALWLTNLLYFWFNLYRIWIDDASCDTGAIHMLGCWIWPTSRGCWWRLLNSGLWSRLHICVNNNYSLLLQTCLDDTTTGYVNESKR